ncbi:MAG: hypothetical protein ACXABI_07810 [Candidatus Hodarchaeales archaeon]|jgi:hypothetical protein
MSNSTFSYKNRTCGECAYLTGKAPIHLPGEMADKEKGLCRLYILHKNFAIMLNDEKACPEFVPN